MTSAPTAHRPASAIASLDGVPAWDAVRLGEIPTGSSMPSPIPASGAAAAVEAVLTAVEGFSTGDRQAVDLEFSVGGEPLAIRVEMRANEVRATFRTDSPELRHALAQEWHAVAAEPADRPVRIADPIFTSPGGAGLDSFAGDLARQGGSGQRMPPRDFVPGLPQRWPAAVPAPAASAAPADVARTGAPSTTHHLHTLA